MNLIRLMEEEDRKTQKKLVSKEKIPFDAKTLAFILLILVVWTVYVNWLR
jgi:hypothetical protein